jgi:hypothetical protein
MKALLAAIATSASVVAGFGANADSLSATPAVETLIACNEVQVPLLEADPLTCEHVVDKNWVTNSCIAEE